MNNIITFIIKTLNETKFQAHLGQNHWKSLENQYVGTKSLESCGVHLQICGRTFLKHLQINI